MTLPRRAAATIANNWQPAALIGGWLTFTGGTTATITQHLGVAPATATAGLLTVIGALAAANARTVEDPA